MTLDSSFSILPNTITIHALIRRCLETNPIPKLV